MKVGYVRVSTIEQSEERQIVELREKAGVEKFFIDKISAKSAKRPKFE
jgi:DNA invertase Pin-like site-specific DNA recombinase